jgi:hypothetical protein
MILQIPSKDQTNRRHGQEDSGSRRLFRLTLIGQGRYDRLVTVQHVKKMRREADRQTWLDLILSLGLNPRRQR